LANVTRTYKQPRRLNAVSLALLLLAGGAGYLGFSSWPVIALNSDVKNVLEDALPRLYRANLLPEPESTIGTEEVKQALIEKLTALGIADPEAAMTITRDVRLVALAVKIDTTIDLKLAGRKIPITLNPRAETSAARVSY
jgi:hypothetical protein